MFVCDYCGRTLKYHYDVCPGCGSSSFHTNSYFGEVVIKEVPKGGYKIKTDSFLKAKRF